MRRARAATSRCEQRSSHSTACSSRAETLKSCCVCSFVEVDEYSKTSADNIYACGDITDRMALTPVALMEGGAIAKTLFNNEPTKPDHQYIPTAVFSQPHIGTCGHTEASAVEEFGDVNVFTSGFTPMRIGFAGGETRGCGLLLAHDVCCIFERM